MGPRSLHEGGREDMPKRLPELGLLGAHKATTMSLEPDSLPMLGAGEDGVSPPTPATVSRFKQLRNVGDARGDAL
eukprot:CAMPEP_0176285550 /NCGR_PEP_ID=MMETSP0121_2-20121125/52428_1 /TAXON_ID=160619 /ORGANISM="Kryptoperidinium foliaceum, Strain CCMP 1326" /LENGTH=74 /DNA_ID=CAMNT_0017626039 /DNA_START=322 /DNA_END=543 /DNA_ORIENTATION=-